MNSLSKPAESGKWEVVRRLRYGALMKLFRHRYGYQFSDDDAGREDPLVLLCVVSLAQSGADKKMAHVIEMWAPWLPADEAAEYIDRINRSTIYDRMPSAKILGEFLNLTNSERERLRLWPIKPVDMSVEQLMEQRKTKERERHKRRRLANGAKPKRTAARPWEAEGIPRSTWYRLRRETGAHAVKTPTHATIVSKQRAEESHGPKRPAGNGEVPSPVLATEAGEAERLKNPSSPDVRAFESHEVDERIAALGNWGANVVEKNSTKFDAFWAFPEQLPWTPEVIW